MRKVGENANLGIAESARGLEIASRYFWEVGLPALENAFPAHVDRVAAGLVAAGSDCSGNDDVISRDYNWGPRFQIFLTPSDYSVIGKDLQDELSRLPACYEGAENRTLGAPGNVVHCIDDFFISNTSNGGHSGFPEAPQDAVAWLMIPEGCLFELTRGQVFYDPLGEFSSRRQSFAGYYPEDAWRRRLAESLLECGAYGQSILPRALARDDYYTSQIAWWRFVESAMKVGFLLNRRYAPEVKWLYREFCKLPELSVDVVNCLWDGQAELLAQPELVSRIAMAYEEKMIELGILPGSLNESAPSFTTRARDIAAAIVDPKVSQLHWRRDFSV